MAEVLSFRVKTWSAPRQKKGSLTLALSIADRIYVSASVYMHAEVTT